MNLRDFKNAVKEIANGKYHTVQVEVAEFSTGMLEVRCRAYIDGRGYTRECADPETALMELRGATLDMIPEGEIEEAA